MTRRRPRPVSDAEVEAFARACLVRVLAATRSRRPKIAVLWTLTDPWASALEAVRRDGAQAWDDPRYGELVELVEKPDLVVACSEAHPTRTTRGINLEAVLARALGGPHLRPRAHLLVGAPLELLIGSPDERATPVRERWLPHSILCADPVRSAGWWTSALRPADGSSRLVCVAPSLGTPIR